MSIRYISFQELPQDVKFQDSSLIRNYNYRKYVLMEGIKDLTFKERGIKAICALALTIISFGIGLFFDSIQKAWLEALSGKELLVYAVDRATLPENQQKETTLQPSPRPPLEAPKPIDLFLSPKEWLTSPKRKVSVFDKEIDKEKALTLVSEEGNKLQELPIDLRKDKELVLAAVKQAGEALQHAYKTHRADKEVVLTAVKQDGSAIQFASPSLKNDREVVLAAVAQRGLAYQYLSNNLRADKEIALEALYQNGMVWELLPESLMMDKAIIISAINSSLKLGIFTILPSIRSFLSVKKPKQLEEDPDVENINIEKQKLLSDPDIQKALQTI